MQINFIDKILVSIPKPHIDIHFLGMADILRFYGYA